MDLLMRELRKKRQSLESDFGGKKLLRRSEIEEMKVQRIREQEQREVQAKALRQHPPLSSSASAPSSSSAQNPSAKSSLPPALASLTALSSKKNSDSISEEQRIDDLVLPRQEVIRRLRMLKQPITLYGEDDDARLERLKMLLKSGILEIDSDMTEGQTNDFLRDISEMRKRQKAGSFVRETKHNRDDPDGMEGTGVEDGEKGLNCDGPSSGPDADKDLNSMKANFEELCDEEKILVFFKRLLIEWNQELDERPEADKRTAKGKSMVATFNQCARYLNPLFKFCRKKVLPDDIRQALMLMVRCCMGRDYLAAMDHYIKMAIGNAPWPIGVTMVGIHERSAREKIYTNSVAHIMNDETTRKYLQSVKRLITFCQRKYPALPSKSVEFNSLANGSDLKSLLADEKIKASASISATEEKLQLMQ